jgi:hypothetical protein
MKVEKQLQLELVTRQVNDMSYSQDNFDYLKKAVIELTSQKLYCEEEISKILKGAYQ